MNERAIYFGRDGNLMGILNTPPESSPDVPAVVLLNAGLLHRVGPNRMNVDLARRLSAKGVISLRFDMSGIGDSGIAHSDMLYFERALTDVGEALDAITRVTGVDEFVLIGLCTGAFNAFGVARRDERVRGVVLLDGYSYPTTKSQLRHYARQAMRPAKWRGLAQRALGSGPANEADQRDMAVFRNEEMPKERFDEEMSHLLRRGVRTMLVYTGHGPLAFNYERQLEDAFPSLPLASEVRVAYYPDADHTFTIRGHRDQVLTDIESWLATEFVEVGV